MRRFRARSRARGELEGAGRLRVGGGPRVGGAHRSAPADGVPGLRLPHRRERADAGARRGRRGSSSTRSTGRRTSSTASPTSPCRSPSGHDAARRAGVVLDPCRDEAFCASRGEGAELLTSSGRRRLAGSARRDLRDSVVHTGVPHRGRSDHVRYLEQLSKVMKEVVGIRRLGAAALDFAYVAAGRARPSSRRDSSRGTWRPGCCSSARSEGSSRISPGGDDMMRNQETVAAMPEVHAALLARIASGAMLAP